MAETVIVTGEGFAAPPEGEVFVTVEDAGAGGELCIDLGVDGDPAALAPHLARTALIRIAFPRTGDGRGFTLAREVRRMGYGGRLRAAGALIPDQWPMARACGFDEIEIDADRARRQPERSWHSAPREGYLDRLR